MERAARGRLLRTNAVRSWKNEWFFWEFFCSLVLLWIEALWKGWEIKFSAQNHQQISVCSYTRTIFFHNSPLLHSPLSKQRMKWEAARQHQMQLVKNWGPGQKRVSRFRVKTWAALTSFHIKDNGCYACCAFPRPFCLCCGLLCSLDGWSQAPSIKDRYIHWNHLRDC